MTTLAEFLVPHPSHQMSDWVANITSAGEEVRRCIKCGGSEYRGPPYGHGLSDDLLVSCRRAEATDSHADWRTLNVPRGWAFVGVLLCVALCAFPAMAEMPQQVDDPAVICQRGFATARRLDKETYREVCNQAFARAGVPVSKQ